MAFNPFTSFRKYQKFWMATILLLCMVTFVLCSNIAGESNWLLDLFRPRAGKVLAKIDGRSIYDSDLHALKDQRQLADKFMRKACDLLDKKLEALMMDKDKKLDEKNRYLVLLTTQDIRSRLQRKHYFETGTSFDDLINHLVWRQEADRLGITLVEKAVEQMFNDEVFFPAFFGQDDAQHVFAEVRGGSKNVSWRTVMDALRDEFRVNIAKLAIARAQVSAYETRGKLELKIHMPPETRISPTPYELWEAYRKNRQEYDIALLPVSAREFLPTLTYLGQVLPVPEESELQKLFDARKDKSYNPSSPESGFERPHQVKAEVISANAESNYFLKPAETLVQLRRFPVVLNTSAPWLSAVVSHVDMDRRLDIAYHNYRKLDPKHYSSVRSLDDLRITDPQNFVEVKRAMAQVPDSWFAEVLYWQHGKQRAESAATLVAGAVADPLGVAYAARVLNQVKATEKDFKAVVEEENKSRALLAARLVGAGAAPNLAPTDYFLWRYDSGQLKTSGVTGGRPFPFAQVKNEMLKKYMAGEAVKGVQHNMQKARDELEMIQNQGIQNLVEFAPTFIEKLVKKYGLTRQVTQPSPYSRDGYYDQFTIHLAPELKDLKDSYLKYFGEYNRIEGRWPNEEGYLKDDQFKRLFFDTQKFSTAQLFQAKPWPPDMTINRNRRPPQDPQNIDMKAEMAASRTRMEHEAKEGKDALVIHRFNSADKPMLFYKSKERQSSLPDKMDAEAHERVLATWRLERAREALALPRAQAIAEKLRELPESELEAALRGEAAKLGPLPGHKEKDRVVRYPSKKGPLEESTDAFARLIKFNSGDGSIGYGEFKIRKDDFEYPRDDMVTQLQTLVDAHKPVETNVKSLDEVNKKLFGMKGKVSVQILANQPRTTYYIAVVMRKLELNRDDFVQAYRKGWRSVEHQHDEFITRAQAEMSKQFMDDLIASLRVLREVTIEASEEDRKGFRDN
jgi:hypothetical protein